MIYLYLEVKINFCVTTCKLLTQMDHIRVKPFYTLSLTKHIGPNYDQAFRRVSVIMSVLRIQRSGECCVYLLKCIVSAIIL